MRPHLEAVLCSALLGFFISPGVFAMNPSSPSTNAGDALTGKLKRTEVQRGQLSVPGREIVQVRTEIPVGVESGWHVHPGEEVGYIVAGTVEMHVQGKPTVTLHAGEGFLIPARVPHNARDLGPGVGEMLSTYVVEIGQPLATLVSAPGNAKSSERAR